MLNNQLNASLQSPDYDGDDELRTAQHQLEKYDLEQQREVQACKAKDQPFENLISELQLFDKPQQPPTHHRRQPTQSASATDARDSALQTILDSAYGT